MFDIKEYSAKNGRITPFSWFNAELIFHVVCFLTTNVYITKNDCKSLENSQENFFDGVSFSKVISLQFSDCNFAIKRINLRLFLEKVLKTSYFLKNKESLFLRKKSIVGQRLDNPAAMQRTALNFIKKLSSCKKL